MTFSSIASVARAVVAVILALSVFSFILANPVQRIFGIETPPQDINVVNAWKEIIYVLIGALAGYINQGGGVVVNPTDTATKR